MQVADQLGQLVISGNQRRRELVGVAGGVAQALNARNLGHVFQQGGKVGHLGAQGRLSADHARAVGVDVLPQQGDFFHALIGQSGHFNQHVFKRAADLFASGVGHHAVAAIFRTAFHDADKGGGAVHARGRQVVKLFDFRKADIDLRAILGIARGQHLRQAVQRLRAKHHVHIRRARDDGRAFLAGHAAAHANEHAFFLQMFDAAQIREHFFLRLFAHRAGVEQNQVGFVHVVGGLVALGGLQHVGHFVGVVLVHLAAKGFDKDFFGHGRFQVICY